MYTTIIDTETVQQNLNHPDWRIIDCRFSLADIEKGRLAYQASHLPNALYAHLDEDLSSLIIPGQTGRHPLPTAETAAQMFSKWGIDGRVQVVVYDDNVGQVASRLWWMLRWLGHDHVTGNGIDRLNFSTKTGYSAGVNQTIGGVFLHRIYMGYISNRM